MRVILGVSASVAIYKAAEIARALMKEGAEVTAVMTTNATRLIDPRLFDGVTGRRTVTDLFDREHAFAHLETARGADVFAVAPATANVIGKLAHGLADDALTTVALAVPCPRLAAPAMNPTMWEKAEVQGNVARLRTHGWTVVMPEGGRAACGDEGVGRLAAWEQIVEEISCLGGRRAPFAGKKIVVTAGPTREPYDAVRVLSNPSSGLMGHELARRAARRGADVTLITGATSVPRFANVVKIIRVNTAAEMYDATRAAFGTADVLVMAAAVSDYRFETANDAKIKKSREKVNITLVPTPDIISELAKNKGNKVILGFAAETDNLIEYSKSKLLSKNIDIVIGNIIGREGVGFGGGAADAIIVTAGTVRELGKIKKTELAETILDEIGKRWSDE